jgi:lysozyme
MSANPKFKRGAAVGLGASVLALALPVVALWEGLSLTPYRDPVGIMTVCYGETAGEMREFTAAECKTKLHESLAAHGADIAACLPAGLPEHVQAASLSFAYNVGAQAFCGSTMRRKLAEGDLLGACAELSRWTYAKGKQLPGLVKRRAAERAMCEGRKT